jgi:hypothetical protein
MLGRCASAAQYLTNRESALEFSIIVIHTRMQRRKSNKRKTNRQWHQLDEQPVSYRLVDGFLFELRLLPLKGTSSRETVRYNTIRRRLHLRP